MCQLQGGIEKAEPFRRFMTPDQYHQVLIGLDRVLFVLHEAAGNLSDDDIKLRAQIALIRSQVLKAESGIPFPFAQAPANSELDRGEREPIENDPDLTRMPWQM
jgi:hypothetical protein